MQKSDGSVLPWTGAPKVGHGFVPASVPSQSVKKFHDSTLTRSLPTENGENKQGTFKK